MRVIGASHAGSASAICGSCRIKVIIFWLLVCCVVLLSIYCIQANFGVVTMTHLCIQHLQPRFQERCVIYCTCESRTMQLANNLGQSSLTSSTLSPSSSSSDLTSSTPAAMRALRRSCHHVPCRSQRNNGLTEQGFARSDNTRRD